jgi:hypothetical protein
VVVREVGMEAAGSRAAFLWRRVEGEDFLRGHQPYFGFMLVKQLQAAIEKVAILCHILLHPLRVLKRFIMNIARITEIEVGLDRCRIHVMAISSLWVGRGVGDADDEINE